MNRSLTKSLSPIKTRNKVGRPPGVLFGIQCHDNDLVIKVIGHRGQSLKIKETWAISWEQANAAEMLGCSNIKIYTAIVIKAIVTIECQYYLQKYFQSRQALISWNTFLAKIIKGIHVLSSRVIMIIFTIETSTSDEICLGTDLFVSKFTNYNWIRTIRHRRWFPATKCIFVHIFYSFKRHKKNIQ